ncbi:MAG: redoxin family protein [Sphingomonas sp.]|jgi:peroxiredoxin|uniref:TlpA family protein disulfide reductase n=1 Tax=Sphingomonas sp. TaxID=28214 RepID=UPI0035634285
MTDTTEMKSAPAALLALLCAACQQQPVSKTTAGGDPQASAPAPGDPAYIAEDPRLSKLVGQPGPAIKLQMVDGTKIDLKKVYGAKPVYLKLWATYCIPCRAQMPGFEKIHETYGSQMDVIAVNAGVGDDAEKVKAFAEKSGMHMPLAIDDGSLGAWIKLQETPLHIIIGRDGRVLYAGHQDGPQVEAAIKTAIAARESGPIATADVASIVALKPGDIVPAMTLRDSRDRPVEFKAGATSRPRAILFSSVWCETYLKDTEPQSVPKCKFAREEVDRVASSSGVEWLGVMSHLWTNPGALAKYEADEKPRIRTAVDSDGTAFRTFGIRRFPAIAVIDKEGRLVRVLGPDETDATGTVLTIVKSR